MREVCKHNKCGEYHYANGTCLNVLNKDRHMMECEDNECEYKEELQILQNEDTQES